MSDINAKKLIVYNVSRFIKKKNLIDFVSTTLFSSPCILIYLSVMPLISPCHRSPDNLFPPNQLPTYLSTPYLPINSLPTYPKKII